MKTLKKIPVAMILVTFLSGPVIDYSVMKQDIADTMEVLQASQTSSYQVK